MRFLIDGNEWSFPHMDSLPRLELLDALRERVAAEGRVIVDMLCDGESLGEDELLSVPDGIDVDVITATPWGLGKDIVDEMKNSLLKVFAAIQRALDAPDSDGTPGLEGAFAELDWMDDVSESLAGAYPEYGGAFPDAEPLRRQLRVFQRRLAEGRYADATAWHERQWKKETLPPFAERVKALESWFEERERRDGGES